jgi:hypothetical protein
MGTKSTGRLAEEEQAILLHFGMDMLSGRWKVVGMLWQLMGDWANSSWEKTPLIHPSGDGERFWGMTGKNVVIPVGGVLVWMVSSVF